MLALCALAVLSACAEPQISPAEDVAKAHYVSGRQPTITLYTMVRNATGKGAHTGLVIDGPERVVFDPAGSWRHPKAPEINDLHYGFTDAMEAWYVDYHARETYSVRRQVVPVSAETARLALERAKTAGPVMDAFCTLRTTEILSGLPGFEDFPKTFFPDGASRAFAQLPGVKTDTYYDDSPGGREDIGGLGGYIAVGDGTFPEPLPPLPATGG
ncbi:MAG: hypothetical protein ACPGNV_06030 [Mangrovicoccus sp.]